MAGHIICDCIQRLAWLRAGVGNVLGNKGGVGVALTYMNHTRLLFVNAHFAAHDHKVAQRQADYLRIKAGLFNTKEEPGASAPPCLSNSLTHLDLQKHTANSYVCLTAY